MDELYDEIIKLITNRDEYLEIFEALKLKYQKTGRLKGIFHLELPSKKAADFLFSISKKEDPSGRISIKAEGFLKEFKAEKYRELDDMILMKKLYGDEFFSKKEMTILEEKIKADFFSSLPLQEWLNSGGNRKIENLYRDSPEKLKGILINIEKFSEIILRNSSLREKNYIPLPTISAIISRDSHYFDMDKIPGKLLINYLCFLSGKEEISTSEEIAELLMEFFIVRDEFFNFTMVYNLFGEESWESFWKCKQPLNLSLYNLKKSHRITGTGKKIFVVENPSVFRSLMEKFILENFECTLVCTSGQLNLSSLIILDRAVKNGNRLFYAGDFDPEGLQIAQKLKLRYGKNLEFFHMEIEDYKSSLSDKSIEKRFAKLESIKIFEFQELVSVMKKEGKAGYQELLIGRYFDFIKKELNY